MLICGEEAGRKCSSPSDLNFSAVAVTVGHSESAVCIPRMEATIPEELCEQVPWPPGSKHICTGL